MPAITGSINANNTESMYSFGGEWGGTLNRGALWSEPRRTNKGIAEIDWNGGYRLDTIGMDASRCSSIYGNSETVTPISFRCTFVIKY